jgi:creatinine amidohydrolase
VVGELLSGVLKQGSQLLWGGESGGAETFSSSRADYKQEYLFYRPKSGVRFGWAAQDLHPSGACGDPTTATAEQGEQVVDHAARVLIQVLEDMDRYPLDLLRDPPLE